MNKLIGSIVLLASPVFAFAQEGQAAGAKTTYFSNPLFNTLLLVIIMLLILVVALSASIKNIIQSDYFSERYKKLKENKGTKLSSLLIFLLLAGNLSAQTAVKADTGVGGIDTFTFYFMIAVIVLEVVVVVLLFNILRTYTREELNVSLTAQAKAVPAKPEKTIIDVFNASVEIERESEILLDHDYDGIKELDNDLPPWWKYGFYLTIVSAFIYMIHYHISGTGDLQLAEYNKEIAAAKLEVEEYMKTSANNVDETTIKLLTAKEDLDAGKQVFVGNCVACHGKAGEGNTVGPNLTDNYWLHGGGIADLFKTVKYGWPDKGMKSWKEDLSPMQMAQVASFIKSLGGSNPPNGKAPQGDLYTENAAAPKDSTAAAATPAPADSVKTK